MGELPLKPNHLAPHRRWDRSVWAWSPEIGRWQPEHGRPKRPVCVAVSTSDVARGEAFDYWRNIAYYHFDAERQPPCGRDKFQAHAYALMTPGGDLCLYRSHGIGGRRTARQIRLDGGDSFAFGMVLSGRRLHRDEEDGVTVAGPGDFFCYDATRVSQVRWEDHMGVHLFLPRAMLEAAVGTPVPPASDLIRQVQQSRLSCAVT